MKKFLYMAMIYLLAVAAVSFILVAAGCEKKSSEADLEVYSVCGNTVYENSVVLTKKEFGTFQSAENKLELIDYEASLLAKVSAVLNEERIVFTVIAEDGTEKEYEIVIMVVSDDTTITVNSVCGVDVVDGKVTLTTLQYQRLSTAENKAEECEYTLAKGASVQVKMEGKMLTFTVTAEDGETTDSLMIALTVLSDEAELRLSGGAGISVEEGVLRCTAEALRELENTDDAGTMLEYTVSEGAQASFTYEANDMTLHAEIVSEDGTNMKKLEWKVGRNESFFAQKALSIGSDDAILWDFEENCYKEEYSSETVRAAFCPDGGGPVAGLNYCFGADVQMEDANIDAEFVIESVETSGSRIRYYMRYLGNGDFRMYTDYLSYNTGWKGFRELGVVENGTARMDVIRFGDVFLFLLNGEVVWKQEIAFGATQIILGGERSVNKITGLDWQTEEGAVRASYEAKAVDFEAPLFGRDVLNACSLSQASFARQEDGSYAFSPTDSKIYAAFAYDGGTALAGQYLEYQIKLEIREHSGKVNPSVGLYILGSNGKILRLYLRRDTNPSGVYETSDYQLVVDNGSGSESAGTQARIRYYENSVMLRVVCNGTYTAVYADGILVFEGDGSLSRIAKDSQGLSFTETSKIAGVTGFRHIGILACGADIRVEPTYARGYTRVLSTYENKIQSYLDARAAGTAEFDTVFAGSSLIEYWNTQHGFPQTMQGVNVGLAGSHSTDWMQLIDRLIVPYSPKKIVLYIGGNDASKQGNEMAPYVAQSVIRLLDAIHAALPEAQIYWISLLSFPALTENNCDAMEAVNEIVSGHIAANSYLHYIDVTPEICPGGTVDSKYFDGGDGVHMNDAGYAVLERVVQQMLSEE